MKLTVTEITVHREDESPVFGELVTHVKLDDEGGGAFVKLIQFNNIQMNEVRFGFNEFEYLVQAVNALKAGVKE
jgi:hypothetical protein